jgi:hypothetical protein
MISAGDDARLNLWSLETGKCIWLMSKESSRPRFGLATVESRSSKNLSLSIP